MLQEIYDENIRDFGENKVQELCDKIEKMPKDIKWHMIGHLQRNKVKYIVGQVALIHSVDSYRLAEEINIQAKKKNIIVPILVEVNIAHEESKFGISEEDAIQLVEEIAELENVRIKGLMTIAPYVENAEDNRLYFRKIKDLSVFAFFVWALFSFTSVFSKLASIQHNRGGLANPLSVCICVSDVFFMFCICDLLAEDHQAL